jgi:iron complex outermembrane receptor protein
MTSSPRHLVKFNFTKPLLGERLRMGVEVHATSRRLEATDVQVQQGSYSVTNLTFTSSQVVPGWSGSLSIKNLFNRSHSDLISAEGRTFWLQLRRDFK